MMEIEEALPSSSKLSPIGNIYRSTYQRANVKAMSSTSSSTSISHDSKTQQQALSHMDKVAASKLPCKMHRSFSLDPLSSEDRKNEEDISTRTIEFLRARLLAERSTAKSAKQKAEELEKKVLELERTLQSEIEKRRSAEAALQESLETMLDSSSSSSKSRSSINTDSELECLSRAAMSEDGHTRYSNQDFNTPASSRRYDSQLEDLLDDREEESKAEKEEQEDNEQEDEKEEENKPEDEKETQPCASKEDHIGESMTCTSRQAAAGEHTTHSLCQGTNVRETASSVIVELETSRCTTDPPSSPTKQCIEDALETLSLSDTPAATSRLDADVGMVDPGTNMKRDGTAAEHRTAVCLNRRLSIEHADVLLEPHLHSESDWASEEDGKDYRYRNDITGDNRSISSSSVVVKEDWDSRSESLASDSEDEGHKEERTLLTSRLHLTQVDHVRKIGRSCQTIKRGSSEKMSSQTEIEEEQVLSELNGWVNHVVNLLEKGSANNPVGGEQEVSTLEASNCSVDQSQEDNPEIQLQGNSSAATEHGPHELERTESSDKSSSITGKSINDSTQKKSYEPRTPTDSQSADSRRSDKVEFAPYVSFAKYLGLTNLDRLVEVQTGKHGTIWRIRSIREGSTEQELISSSPHTCKGGDTQISRNSSGKTQAKEKSSSSLQSAISFTIPIQNGEKEAEGGVYRHQLNLQLDIGIKSMAQDRDAEHQVQGKSERVAAPVESSLRKKQKQCSKGYDVAVSESGDFICMDISYNGATEASSKSKQLLLDNVCKARASEQPKGGPQAAPSRDTDSVHVNKCHKKLLDKLQEFGCFQKRDTIDNLDKLSPVERREMSNEEEKAVPDAAVVTDSKMEDIFKALKAAKQQLRSSIERRQLIEKQLLTMNP